MKLQTSRYVKSSHIPHVDWFGREVGGKYLVSGIVVVLALLIPSMINDAHAEVAVSSCGTLDIPGETYVLSQDLTSSYTCIKITADGITFDGNGHTITGSNSGYGVEVWIPSTEKLSGPTGVTVKNTNISSFSRGINVLGSKDTVIINNIVTNNSWSGIQVGQSCVATITGNTVHSNHAGIVAQYSTGITIDGNNADSNSQDGIIVSNAPGTVVRGNSALTAGAIGISIQFSNDNIIIENTVSGNTAIHVWGSTGNTLIKNNIESCSDCNTSYGIGVVGITLTEAHRNTFSQNDIDSTHLWGIFLIDSNENTFSDNVISNHQKEIASNASGLLLRNSHDNTFKYNTISNNERPYTIWDSANNKIYNNNFISNFNEGLLYDNVDPTGVIYSAESTVFNLDLPIGGNYWDNFDEISEGCEDLNNDSFCDSPFIDPTDIIRYSENSPEYYGMQDNFAWSVPDGWLVNSPIIPDLDSIIIPEVVHCPGSEPDTPTCTEPEVLDTETNMCVMPEPEVPVCEDPGVLDTETNTCVIPEPDIPTVVDGLICHIPPGNPENPQTILISPNAFPAHLAHGDYKGACTGIELGIQDFRLPIHVVKEINIYLRAARKLSQTLDREPSPEDVAEMLDRPIEDVKRMLGLNERVTSVDMPTGHDSNKSLLDTIPDEQNTDPSLLLQNSDVQRHIDTWLSQLTDKQCAVVESRFGLHGREVATLEEIGNELGVTRERVRQIQIEAIRRLRQILEREGFSLENLFVEN